MFTESKCPICRLQEVDQAVTRIFGELVHIGTVLQDVLREFEEVRDETATDESESEQEELRKGHVHAAAEHSSHDDEGRLSAVAAWYVPPRLP